MPGLFDTIVLGDGRSGSASMQKKDPPFVMERYGRLSEMDRSFDIAYWQRLGPAAIFEAAWQMVVDAHSRGRDGVDELRLRRTVEKLSTPAGVKNPRHCYATYAGLKAQIAGRGFWIRAEFLRPWKTCLGRHDRMAEWCRLLSGRPV